MPTVATDGADIHYTVQGAGPTFLVPTSIGTRPYERQMAVLSRHLRLVFVDVRGGGQSTGAPADLTFDRFADDLEAVRQALGGARIGVLGHSVLGIPVIEYGRRKPEAVSHVVLVGTPPRGDMARLQREGAAYWQAQADDDRKQVLAENLTRLAPGTSPAAAMLAQTPARFYDPRFDAAPLFEGAQANPALLGHLMGRLVPAWDVTAPAPPLRAATLIALGRHDYIVPCLLWDAARSALPTASVRVFERSGHQSFVEEPDAFAEAVTRFL